MRVAIKPWDSFLGGYQTLNEGNKNLEMESCQLRIRPLNEGNNKTWRCSLVSWESPLNENTLDLLLNSLTSSTNKLKQKWPYRPAIMCVRSWRSWTWTLWPLELLLLLWWKETCGQIAEQDPHIVLLQTTPTAENKICQSTAI